MDSPVNILPKQVALFIGESSSLVLDRIRQASSYFDTCVYVTEPEQLQGLVWQGIRALIVAIDPSEELLRKLASRIKQGDSEAIAVVISGEISRYSEDIVNVVKKKAMQSKNYFVISPPKTEAARDKMVSFFVLKLKMSKDLSTRVCSAMEYSPGRMYLFAKQYLMCTDGQVLPSSKASGIVDSLVGNESPNMAVMNIVNGVVIESTFSEDFTQRVLNFIHNIILDAKRVKLLWETGNTNPTKISKESGIPTFRVLKCLPLAVNYSLYELRQKEDLILFMLKNASGNSDALSTLSRLWK